MGATNEDDDDKRVFTARPQPRRMRLIPTPPPLDRRAEGPDGRDGSSDEPPSAVEVVAEE